MLFDKATYDKLLKEVPTYKLITPSIVSERLKVRGSLARKALAELLQKGNYFQLCVKTKFYPGLTVLIRTPIYSAAYD